MGKATKAFIASILGGALLVGSVVSAAAADMRWPAGSCKPWAYTKAGGFRENEPEAWVSCKAGKGEQVRLSLICHGSALSIRYTRVLKGKMLGPTAVRQKITYRFVARTYVDYARYEGALTDWVIYRARFDHDHPMFKDFASSPPSSSVAVKLEKLAVTDLVPLTNAAAAIKPVLKACRP